MDHQDWPGWPGDDSHLDDQHLDDGGGHQHFDDAGIDGDHHLDHLVEPAPELPAHDHGFFGTEAEPELVSHTGHLSAAYPDDDPFGADLHHGSHLDDVPSDVHDEPLADTPVGTDPDTDPHADGDWPDGYPPALDLPDAPAPVDGYPWADAALIGTDMPDSADVDPPAIPDPPVGDLLDYAGTEHTTGADAWQALLGSDDPATSTLARWWSPRT
jgi:hypothetical protein